MRRTLAAACAVMFLVAVPAASAAPAWLGAMPIAPEGTGPAVATGPLGDTVVTWLRAGGVEARTRPWGGSFGEVQRLGGATSAPEAAMADDGTAVVAWPALDGVHYAIRAAGATGFGATQVLATPTAPSDVELAMNARGDALIAFARGGAWAALRAAGGAFEDPTPLRAGDACDLRAALGANGDAAVAWHDTCGGTGPARVVRRPAGAGYGGVETVDQSTRTALAVAADGTTILGQQRSGVVYAAIAPPGAGFSPTRLSAAGETADFPAVAAGGTTLWAAWRSSGRVHLAGRPPGGAFSVLPAVSAEGADVPALGASTTGSAVVAWLRTIGEISTLESARAASTAAADPAVAVSAGAAAAAPDLTVDSLGNAVAGFVQGGIVAQVLDGAGPFMGINGRPTGFAKERYPFAVAVVDAWSAVSGSSFDFGDGSTAPGPTTAHAFPRPGVFTITAAAIDALGNANTTTHRIEILPELDRTPPAITKARLDATRFRVTRRPTPVTDEPTVALTAAVAKGTRFRYTLSEPATVTIFFEKAARGYKRGKRCVRTRRGRAKRCRRYTPAALIARTHRTAGAVSVGFTGRITTQTGAVTLNQTTLRPGRYRASLIAADARRNASRPTRLSFTVVR